MFVINYAREESEWVEKCDYGSMFGWLGRVEWSVCIISLFVSLSNMSSNLCNIYVMFYLFIFSCFFFIIRNSTAAADLNATNENWNKI